jgi:regulator of nonsense transcripts 1
MGEKGQVLVTAPSNTAVDHLTEKIAMTGLRVVRLAARSREHIISSVESLSLHEIVANMDSGSSDCRERRNLYLLKQEQGELSRQDNNRLKHLWERAEIRVLEKAQVICCTCSGAADSRLADFRFKKVLIDEATQAPEPSSLIPIVKGAKQVVLVGDHCQLGPVVKSKPVAKCGFTTSMFERLVLLGIRPVRLQIQYRMHPFLSEFPSNMFYEGTLQNGVSELDRSSDQYAFPWVHPSRPILFQCCNSPEEISGSGVSFLNRLEASRVVQAVTALLKGGVRPENIGVITPYLGQRTHVISSLARTTDARLLAQYQEVEVASVDAFQGREKDFIIITCVRSNEYQGIGFLSDARRLNVALTRAKRGIVVVGNARLLAKNALWNAFLAHLQDHGCLVEGSLDSLSLCSLQLPRPQKKLRDKREYYMTALAHGITPQGSFSTGETPMTSHKTQRGWGDVTSKLREEEEEEEEERPSSHNNSSNSSSAPLPLFAQEVWEEEDALNFFAIPNQAGKKKRKKKKKKEEEDEEEDDFSQSSVSSAGFSSQSTFDSQDPLSQLSYDTMADSQTSYHG